MGMFNASQAKSDKSWALIRAAFGNGVEDGADYTLAYGYFLKSGLLSKKMYNYAVGFQKTGKNLILLPIDSDGNVIGDSIRLDEKTISSVKKTLQGAYRISSSLMEKPIELTVPGFVPDSGEDVYQLPINQQDEAAAFVELMKAF